MPSPSGLYRNEPQKASQLPGTYLSLRLLRSSQAPSSRLSMLCRHRPTRIQSPYSSARRSPSMPASALAWAYTSSVFFTTHPLRDGSMLPGLDLISAATRCSASRMSATAGTRSATGGRGEHLLRIERSLTSPSTPALSRGLHSAGPDGFPASLTSAKTASGPIIRAFCTMTTW